MLRECEAFYESELDDCLLLYDQAVRSYVAGLAYFRLYRYSRDLTWFHRGQKRTREMQHWAEQGSSFNFEHRFRLMKAEEQYCSGEYESAKQSYKSAISMAKTHYHLADEAIGCELYGKFFLATGNITSSLDYFTLAHEKFVEYGAVAKATQLFAYIKDSLSLG